MFIKGGIKTIKLFEEIFDYLEKNPLKDEVSKIIGWKNGKPIYRQ